MESLAVRHGSALTRSRPVRGRTPTVIDPKQFKAGTRPALHKDEFRIGTRALFMDNINNFISILRLQFD